MKFTDADLIGIPVRVTVGKKSAEGGTVDLRRRNKEDQRSVPIAEVAKAAAEEWAAYEVGA